LQSESAILNLQLHFAIPCRDGALMPWIIGIDEAGYGPNLGPLVMTSVACRVPDQLIETNLWKVLDKVVRRQSDPEDSRFVVDDSKLVYSPTIGLAGLETAVCSILASAQSRALVNLKEYIDFICPSAGEELQQEAWFTGRTPVPFAQQRIAYQDAIAGFTQGCQDCGIQFGPVHSVVICPPRFNQLLDHWHSKGAILGHGLSELLLRGLESGARDQESGVRDEEPIDFVIDKHGGRNCYFAMLQEALGERMVVAHEETFNRSRYSVCRVGEPIRFTFQPRADGEHFCVALASMASKYLRELLMVEFNEFWRNHLPDLQPTAGYPGDSRRFYKAIRPVAKRLGIQRTALWRRR
jgi:ribonuclease HII